MDGERVHGLVDRLFRREAGRLTAALTRSFGPAHLDLAEEVVQEALVEALRRWPFHGIPEKPAAWIYRVARNRALDRLRRRSTFADKTPAIRALVEERMSAARRDPRDDAMRRLEGGLADDQVRMLFLCCHPVLGRDARVSLTLKVVAGFGTGEIARALFATESTVAQRIVRAKRTIRRREIGFELPGPKELAERLDAVLEVIYLVFNEGYAAHAGDRLIRDDLVAEALRMIECLAADERLAGPKVHALASLLCFQASRLTARVDPEGELVLLEDQDRSLWDRRLVARGFRHLERAAAGIELTTYHVQAAIAAEHAGGTDPERILAHYDRLLTLDPTPVVALNRAVALARARGAKAGLDALRGLAAEEALESYYLFHAVRADLLARSGQAEGARNAYRLALRCTASEPERRFLERRLAELQDDDAHRYACTRTANMP